MILSIILNDSLKAFSANNSELNNLIQINNYMPWIVALMIGVLTIIANILINKNQSKNAEKTLKIQSVLSLKSIQKDILSNNRQEWINSLRNYVSNYIASHEMSKIIVQNDKNNTPEYRVEFKKWQSFSYKIELMLNPIEEKSKELKELMTDLNLATDYSSFAKEQSYESIKNDIIKITQNILKEEWERVKSIE